MFEWVMDVTKKLQELGVQPSEAPPIIYQKMKELFYSNEQNAVDLLDSCIYSLGRIRMAENSQLSENEYDLERVKRDCDFEQEIIVSFLNKMAKENNQDLFNTIYKTKNIKSFYLNKKKSGWFVFDSLQSPCVLFQNFSQSQNELLRCADLCSVYQEVVGVEPLKMMEFLVGTKRKMTYHFDDGGFLGRMKFLMSYSLFEKNQVTIYQKSYNEALGCLFNDLSVLLTAYEFCDLLSISSNLNSFVDVHSGDKKSLCVNPFYFRIAKNVLVNSDNVLKALGKVEELIEIWASEETRDSYNATKEKLLIDSQLVGVEGSLRAGRVNKI